MRGANRNPSRWQSPNTWSTAPAVSVACSRMTSSLSWSSRPSMTWAASPAFCGDDLGVERNEPVGNVGIEKNAWLASRSAHCGRRAPHRDLPPGGTGRRTTRCRPAPIPRRADARCAYRRSRPVPTDMSRRARATRPSSADSPASARASFQPCGRAQDWSRRQGWCPSTPTGRTWAYRCAHERTGPRTPTRRRLRLAGR